MGVLANQEFEICACANTDRQAFLLLARKLCHLPALTFQATVRDWCRFLLEIAIKTAKCIEIYIPLNQDPQCSYHVWPISNKLLLNDLDH